MRLVILSVLMSIQNPAHDIEGLWNTNKDNTIIRIYENKNIWFGEIVSSDNSLAKGGTIILKNMIYKDDKWIGKFYSIKFNKLYDAEMVINKDNSLNLTAGTGFLSKTVKWDKISSL